jgi:CNT family concentrative nucleoside transporter
MEQYRGILGIVTLLFLGFLFSAHRTRINWRLVATGVALQAMLAWLFLSFEPVAFQFQRVGALITRVITFADSGIEFIFGKELSNPTGPWGFIFAVKVLPIIIFFAALMGILYHLGIMQRVVAAFAWVLRKTLGITGAEALCAATNIFVGQTEAPLVVKPFIGGMTRSQLTAVMSGGFATIAGSVMAAYIGILGGPEEARRTQFAVHLLTASIMSAPGGLVMAKLLMPETEQPMEEAVSALAAPRETVNVIDAAVAGASDGLKLALNVGAMLIAFVALIALLNWPIAAFGDTSIGRSLGAILGLQTVNLESLLSVPFKPLAWLMGVSWPDCGFFGSLLGKQLVATEFVAYLSLAEAINPASGGASTISPRTAAIATYALCGFANFASIGIQIGGLSAIAPERRSDLAKLAFRAMCAGAMACWMTGAVASICIPA